MQWQCVQDLSNKELAISKWTEDRTPEIVTDEKYLFDHIISLSGYLKIYKHLDEYLIKNLSKRRVQVPLKVKTCDNYSQKINF